VKAGVRAVSCVLRRYEFVIYCMHAINPFGTRSIQDAIPHSLGNQVQTKNPEQGCCGVSENETSGSKKILPRLGVHRDRDGRRPSASAYGDSPEICGEYGGRGVEEEYESRAQQEVSFSEGFLLGQ